MSWRRRLIKYREFEEIEGLDVIEQGAGVSEKRAQLSRTLALCTFVSVTLSVLGTSDE